MKTITFFNNKSNISNILFFAQAYTLHFFLDLCKVRIFYVYINYVVIRLIFAVFLSQFSFVVNCACVLLFYSDNFRQIYHVTQGRTICHVFWQKQRYNN